MRAFRFAIESAQIECNTLKDRPDFLSRPAYSLLLLSSWQFVVASPIRPATQTAQASTSPEADLQRVWQNCT